MGETRFAMRWCAERGMARCDLECDGRDVVCAGREMALIGVLCARCDVVCAEREMALIGVWWARCVVVCRAMTKECYVCDVRDV